MNSPVALHRLNECQVVDDYIYCNRFQYNDIYKIDLLTGDVHTKYDMKDLYRQVRSFNNQQFNFC